MAERQEEFVYPGSVEQCEAFTSKSQREADGNSSSQNKNSNPVRRQVHASIPVARSTLGSNEGA